MRTGEKPLSRKKTLLAFVIPFAIMFVVTFAPSARKISNLLFQYHWSGWEKILASQDGSTSWQAKLLRRFPYHVDKSCIVVASRTGNERYKIRAAKISINSENQRDNDPLGDLDCKKMFEYFPPHDISVE
jgi:hypothetical protein